jgi:hypothetical protein
MLKHYAYRVDHDVGFAPNVQGDICTVCGCKSTTVERWAAVGSWTVGIGGIGTGHPDALIYAMRVDATPSLADFAKRFPVRSRYLLNQGIPFIAPVLLSRYFYYFGDHAITLPRWLRHMIIDRDGCKKLADADVIALDRFLSRNYSVGVHGQPNNAANVSWSRPSCSCSANLC